MKLSIITVNYNDAKGLQRTIESVLCQTFHDYEFIVIDGGSTDGSVEVIKRYEKYIDYWVSEQDGGIYPGMNKGLRQAKGEYVNFMNGGDCYHSSDVLEKIFSKYVLGKMFQCLELFGHFFINTVHGVVTF